MKYYKGGNRQNPLFLSIENEPEDISENLRKDEKLELFPLIDALYWTLFQELASEWILPTVSIWQAVFSNRHFRIQELVG